MNENNGDPHVDPETLGSHFLGELSPARTDAVHRHLRECASCRAQGDIVAEAAAALAFLELEDVVARPSPAPPSPTRRKDKGNDNTRPASRTRGKRKRLVRLGSMLALLLVVAGLGIGALLAPRGGRDVQVATANATARDDRSGASLSVFVTGLDDGSTRVRATVSGLKAGEDYVLTAVTADGEPHAVARWTGTPGVRDVTGDLVGVAVGRFSSFNVLSDPGGTLVTVHLTSTAGTNKGE
jgi:hypothetical protein